MNCRSMVVAVVAAAVAVMSAVEPADAKIHEFRGTRDQVKGGRGVMCYDDGKCYGITRVQAIGGGTLRVQPGGVFQAK